MMLAKFLPEVSECSNTKTRYVLAPKCNFRSTGYAYPQFGSKRWISLYLKFSYC